VAAAAVRAAAAASTAAVKAAASTAAVKAAANTAAVKAATGVDGAAVETLGSSRTLRAGSEVLVEAGFGAGIIVHVSRYRRGVIRGLCIGHVTNSGPICASSVLLPSVVRRPEDMAVAAGEEILARRGNRPSRRERSRS
jgi:hypothetical protein